MSASQKPNIILLVLDTQQARRLSMYGYAQDTSPVLGELAQDSTVFERAIATAPWTVPSHASLFTGLYPTVHQTAQTYLRLSPSIPTSAELLSQHGYKTVAFCNNPLVGLLRTGLDRGFERFYNYSGVIPDIPEFNRQGSLFGLQHRISKFLQRFTTAVESSAGTDVNLLRLGMNPWFVPMWTGLGKFKGNTRRSIRDASDYVRYHTANFSDQPFYMFINMMETHLPYYPPAGYLNKWVPQVRREKTARDFLQKFNTQSYRWVAPMIDPLSPEEQALLRDVYNAEINYQDAELHTFIRALKETGALENTLLIVTADHGESHGDHNFMGHAFVTYDEIAHVPLFIHAPGHFPAGKRISEPVSIRRVFHTTLEAAGVEETGSGYPAPQLSLTRSAQGGEPEGEIVVSEAFPPLNFISVMEMNNPEAIDRFRCRLMRRSVYEGSHVLMTVGEQSDEFFDVAKDPFQQENLLDRPFGYENTIIRLERMLEDFVAAAEAARDQAGQVAQAEDYSSNPELVERLRALGYLE